MKAILLTTVLAVILLLNILPLYVSAQAVEQAEGLGRYNESGGIVPRCNTTPGPDGRFTDPCTPCHIFKLLENILNFLWWGVSIPVVTLFILYGGVLMVVPFGGEKSASMHTKGKKVITNALVGLAIVFFSWVLVDTTIKAVGGQRIGASETGQVLMSGGTFGPWNVINCNITGSPAQTVAPLSIQPQTEQNRIRNDAISNIASRIQGSLAYGSADCRDLGGTSVGPRTTMSEVAAGRPVTVCQSGCNGQSVCRPDPRVTINPRIINSVDALQQERFQFAVSSITTGAHSNISCHYSGDGLDITSPSRQDYERIRARLQQLGGEARCETNSGQLLSVCPSDTSTINHVHVCFTR